ncbi:MAG: NrfD/PsrC family molybdoenzyme membrane anchor subunit [Mariprofundaceae bacterium]
MELNWGMPVILYLFLGGLGAGAMTMSAFTFLRSGGGGFGPNYFAEARYGALLAPLPVMIGCGMLIFELGSFHAGYWFKWINLYMTINLSPMSIGTWLLTLFIAISLAYAFTFLKRDASPDDSFEPMRKILAWMALPVGISVAIYTGVLLGAMPARPFWNSPVLPLVFLFSSLSTGVALILLARSLFGNSAVAESDHAQSSYLLSSTDTVLIGFELLALFLFLLFAQLTVGDVGHAASVILFGGTSIQMYGMNLAATFWFWVILVGLLIPLAIELRYVVPRLLHQREFALPRVAEFMVPVAILIGGFVLRYVVVIAGQVTGPIGI